MGNRLAPGSSVSPHEIRQDMRRAGYTDIAVSLSLESLTRTGMIEFDTEADFRGDPYPVCRITQKGIDWLLENRERLRMTETRE